MILKLFILTLILLAILLTGMAIKLLIDPDAEFLHHDHRDPSNATDDTEISACPGCGIRDTCEVKS